MATYNGTPGNDTYNGGSARDTIYGGAGNDTLNGGGGGDLIDGGADSDLVDGGKGNDVLVYRLAENLGKADRYSGGLEIDTLRLEFTGAEWRSAIVQAQVGNYLAYLANTPRNRKGELPAGSEFTFDFGASTTLRVTTVERLEIRVDGILVGNNAPTIASAQATGAVTEDGSLSASGTIDFLDLNLGDDHGVAVLGAAGYTNPVGGTMTAQITDPATGDGTGRVTWTYQVPNAATQFLAAGQSAVEKFDVRITDSTGRAVTQTVSITVNGVNDGVSITSSAQSGTLVEDVAPGASGTVTFTDPDLSDAHTASFVPAPGNTTAFGAFALTAVSEAPSAANGSVGWSYTLNAAAQSLAAGQSVSETYIVTVGDGHGSAVTQNVVIAITGTNDAPVLSAQDTQGAVGEAGTPVGNLADSGTLGFSDVDLTDTHLVPAAGTPIGATLGALGAVLDRDTDNGTGGQLTWTYSVAAAAVEYLSDGQQRTESFTIAVDDQHGGQPSRQINVIVTGTNDGVSITSGAQTGTVIEDAAPSAAGAVTFTDVDLDDGHTAAFMAAPGNTTALGTFALGAVNEAPGAANGSVGWSYTLNGAAAQYLGAGETIIETYVVSIGDGHGSTATRQVVITITGTADGNPTADASMIATNKDLAIIGKLSASPASPGDTLTFGIGTAPSHGALQLQADGSYRYTPATGYTGPDGFSFVVTDDHGGTATADATIEVAATGTGQVRYIDPAALQTDDPVSPPVARCWEPPEMAALAGGGHVVVWAAYDQSGYGIFQVRYGSDGNRIGTPERVNTAPAGNQLHASVAAAGAGWVVTWSADDGSGWGVHARRYDAAGAALGGPERVNPEILGDQAQASVAELAGGGYVVSWTGYDGGNGTTDVHARTYAADGTATSGAFVVNAGTAGSQRTDGAVTENAAGLAGGRFVVVWSDEDSTGPGVFVRVFEANGTAVADEFPAASATGYGRYASVAAVGQGFVVTWSAWGQDGSGTAVFARRFDAGGQALGNAFQVNAWTLGDQLYPKAQALSDGGFVIAWQSFGAAGSDNADICGRRYDANGIAVGGEFLIGGNLGDDRLPALALRNGTLMASWLDGSLGTIEQRAIDDFAADTTSLGDFRIDDQVSPPTVNGGDGPEAAALGGGGHVVAWTGYGGAGGTLGVYQQRYDNTGAKIGAPQRVDPASGEAGMHASVAATADGGWVVAWTSWTGNAWDIHARRYAADGQALDGATPVGAALGADVAANAGELASGGYVLSWSGYDAGSGTSDVHARLYDSGGTATGNAFVVNSTTAGSQVVEGATENVAGLAGGRFAVVWTGDGASGPGVYGRVFGANGAALADQFAIGTATGSERYASVGAVGNGFVVAWNADDGSGVGVYARRYDADGTPLDNPVLVNGGRIAADQAHPKVQALADGGFVVVWQNGAAGSNDADIFGRRYDIAGNAVGAEFRIGARLGDNLLPALALNHGALVAVWADGTFGTIEQKVVDSFLADTTPAGSATAGDPVSPPVMDGAQAEAAALSGGGHVVVWSGYYGDDPAGSGIYQQRYDAAGAKIGAPQRVNTTVAGDQAHAGVAANGSGWVVIWASYDAATETSTVFAQRYGADGTPIGGETVVNQAALPWWAPGPCIGELANGGYVVSWDGMNAGTVDVYARIYAANGTAGNAFIVNAVTAGDQTTEGASSGAENVIGLADGRFVVVWQGSDSLDHVYGRVFAAAGNAVTGQFEIGNTTNNYAASVAAVGTGFVVTWTSWGQDVADIYAQRYDGNGGTVGAAFRVNPWGLGEQAFSKVQALADGGFVVVWQSYGATGSDQGWAISGRRYDAGGNAVGGEFIVGTPGAPGERDALPSIALRADGALVVVWQNGEAGSIEQKIVTSFDAGSAQAKNLIGGDGSDSFIGSDLADTLAGAGGDDRLDGLLGGDRLGGGNGADAFVFSTAPGAGNIDTVTDFLTGVDIIHLSNAAGSPFAGLASGPLASAAFDVIGDGTAPTVATRVIYDPDSGALYFDADGEGGAPALQFAVVLLGNQPAALTLGDFVIGA